MMAVCTDARLITLRAGAVLLMQAVVSATCIAQTGSHLADPAQAAPSRWAADSARVDEQIRLRGMSADNPRAHWVAAHFDLTDVASRAKHYAAARANAPQEKLYLASLAMACLEPVQPTLPECDATDRLTDWTTRDADNGFPLLLLAARASKRNDDVSTVAYLEQAATMPRIDDYWSRGFLEFWDYVMTLPIEADRAAKAEAAIGYAAAQPHPITSLFPSNVCLGASGATDSRRPACAKAGAAMAERGTTAATRSVGASIAERNAADTGAAERARTQSARRSLRAIRYENLPSLSANGAYIESGQETGTLAGSYNLQLLLNVPILDGFRRQNRSKEQSARVEIQELREHALANQIETEARQAVLDLSSAEQQVAIALERVRLAATELAEAQQRFQAGVAGSVETTNAQSSVISAHDALIQARVNYGSARVRAYRALGVIDQLQ